MTYRCDISGPHNHSSLDDPIDCDRADRPGTADHMDVTAAVTHLMQNWRAIIAAEIEQFADDDSDVSDAYRHAALIAKGIPSA